MEAIENDVVKKMHKCVMDELTMLQGGKTTKVIKNKNKKGKKKKGEDDDEKEDEETRLEIEAKKQDKTNNKKINVNLTRRDNLAEMVGLRFVRKIRPCHINDLVGSFDYISHEKVVHNLKGDDGTYEPSLHQIKNFAVCNLIIPLASKVVRERICQVDKKYLVRSVLFYGPTGTGK